jgi:hypothetical protein
VAVSFQHAEKWLGRALHTKYIRWPGSIGWQVAVKNGISDARACSVVLILIFLNVTSLFLHLLFFYYAVHVVVYRQVFQFCSIFPFIEYKLKLVLLSIRQSVVPLTARNWWWWENWVNSDFKCIFYHCGYKSGQIWTG